MKIYERNRDGKPYPVFEINAIDLVQQYIEHCDVEQFIADYIGEDRFLKVAVQAIKDSYASTTTDPNILKAKGELADALGFQYAKAMADDFAYKSATDEYYAEMFRRLYRAINNFASEKNSGWYQFWSRYCTENPEVRIGDREWSAMQDMYRKEVWHRVESRMADVLQQHGKHDVKKALWWFEETFNNFKAFKDDQSNALTVIHQLLQKELSKNENT